ncbi:MAG: hypothetical protein GX430_06685 [Treponema sp.]|nr:hypothetical protein [Treponema sp.]
MRKVIAALLLAALALAPLAAQPKVSEKQEVAIFAMGYYGFNIPREALGSIDLEIQKVFLDLGRFTVIGYAQRFSSTDVQAFVDILKKAKETNFVLPEKYQFGEAFLTAADFEKLLGAFQVAIPVVVSFDSAYSNKNGRWETNIKTSVSFVDAGTGTLTGIADVQTSGTDKSSQLASIQGAIGAIPMELQYKIRSIPAFTLNTRVLAASGKEIKLQLGTNMGIKKGDEYSIIVASQVAGFRDEREQGLVLIKDVGPEVSTGLVLYSSVKPGPDTQLKEIPRRGVDAAPYLHLAQGSLLRVIGDEPEEDGTNIIVGLRMPLSRGFFDVRPYAAVQMPVNGIRTILSFVFIPVNVLVGAEYNLYMGRLAITPYAGIGTSFIYITEALSGSTYDTSDMLFPHFGVQAYLNMSYLFNRNTKLFAEAGFEYWLALTQLYSNYGGVSFGGGVSFKL